MRIGGDFEPGKLPLEEEAAKIAGEQIPPHIAQLGQKLGITKYFVGVEMPQTGLNLSHGWFSRVIDYYRDKGFSPMDSRYAAGKTLDDEIQKLRNLMPQEKADITKAVKEGKSVVMLHPRVKGRGTAIHETMHTLIEDELGKDLSGKVDLAEVGQLILDAKDSDKFSVRDLSENLKWITRRQEYFTETMTQYFMGNLKAGSRTLKLAEAILRHSQNPLVRDLIGTSLGTAISFGLWKKLQGKQPD